MPTSDGMATIVTGGTGALGQAITLRLLRDGARVSVPWVVEAERDTLLSRAVSAGDRLHLERADATDEDDVARFVEAARRRHGRLQALVTAVGGFAGGDLVATDRASWDRMLTLNLTATYVAARAVLRHLLEAGRGRIVTIASRAVVPPAAGFIAYTVAKSGVIAFTQALAAETRSTGITVNAVLPSTMDTPANRAAMPGVDPKEWVPVDDVAAAVAFLLSEDAAHVTGTLLAI